MSANQDTTKLNPLGLLEQICQKRGSLQRQQFETQEGRHGAKLTFGEFFGEAFGSNRKIALNLAAKEVLLQIVDCGKHNEFGLPATTADEARKYILSLLADLEQEELRENWVGRNESLCIQKKLSTRPEYQYSEETVDNVKLFVCTCKLRDIVVQEKGSSKKKAKNLAAKLMFDKISSIPDPEVLITQVSLKSNEKSENIAPEPIDNSEDEIHSLLKGRIRKDHIKHTSCDSSEALLSEICAVVDNSRLNKIWPHRKIVYYIDNDNLVEIRSNENYKNPLHIYRVFLEIQDKSGRPINLFMAMGSTIDEAKSIAACRAVSYIQSKFGIH